MEAISHLKANHGAWVRPVSWRGHGIAVRAGYGGDYLETFDSQAPNLPRSTTLRAQMVTEEWEVANQAEVRREGVYDPDLVSRLNAEREGRA